MGLCRSNGADRVSHFSGQLTLYFILSNVTASHSAQGLGESVTLEIRHESPSGFLN